MPWNECKPMDERLRFVARLLDGDKMAALRACEIASLKVGDVVSVMTDGWDVDQEIRLKSHQTKGNKTQTVVLSSRLRTEFKEYLQQHPYLRQDSTSPLFVTQKGGGFTSQAIQNLFHTLYEAAGIAHASRHGSRRTFITALSEKGVSVRVIQELARHSSLSTTQRYTDEFVIDVQIRRGIFVPDGTSHQDQSAILRAQQMVQSNTFVTGARVKQRNGGVVWSG